MMSRFEAATYRKNHPRRIEAGLRDRLWNGSLTLITNDEIAERIGMKAASVSSNSTRKGFMPFDPVQRGSGGRVYYRRTEAEAWIAAGAPDRTGKYRVAPDQEAA